MSLISLIVMYSTIHLHIFWFELCTFAHTIIVFRINANISRNYGINLLNFSQIYKSSQKLWCAVLLQTMSLCEPCQAELLVVGISGFVFIGFTLIILIYCIVCVSTTCLNIARNSHVSCIFA